MKQQKAMKKNVNHSQRKLLEINSKINNPEKKNTKNQMIQQKCKIKWTKPCVSLQ